MDVEVSGPDSEVDLFITFVQLHDQFIYQENIM